VIGRSLTHGSMNRGKNGPQANDMSMTCILESSTPLDALDGPPRDYDPLK